MPLCSMRLTRWGQSYVDYLGGLSYLSPGLICREVWQLVFLHLIIKLIAITLKYLEAPIPTCVPSYAAGDTMRPHYVSICVSPMSLHAGSISIHHFCAFTYHVAPSKAL